MPCRNREKQETLRSKQTLEEHRKHTDRVLNRFRHTNLPVRTKAVKNVLTAELKRSRVPTGVIHDNTPLILMCVKKNGKMLL